MNISNIGGSSSNCIFSLSNPHVKNGLIITALIIGLTASLALIALGWLGLIPIVPGVLCGVGLLQLVVFVGVLQLISGSSMAAKFTVKPSSKFDQSNISKIVHRYREEQKLSPSVPYRALNIGSLKRLSIAAQYTSQTYPEGHVQLSFKECEPPACVNIQNDGERILVLIAEGMDVEIAERKKSEFDESTMIEETVRTYRIWNRVFDEMPYRVEYAGTISQAMERSKMVRMTSYSNIPSSHLMIEPQCLISLDIQHNGEEILVVFGKTSVI